MAHLSDDYSLASPRPSSFDECLIALDKLTHTIVPFQDRMTPIEMFCVIGSHLKIRPTISNLIVLPKLLDPSRCIAILEPHVDIREFSQKGTANRVHYQNSVVRIVKL